MCDFPEGEYEEYLRFREATRERAGRAASVEGQPVCDPSDGLVLAEPLTA